MIAHFQIVGSFTLTQPQRLVLYGDILDGSVRVGMFLQLREPSGRRHVREIERVEYVDSLGERTAYVGLVLRPYSHLLASGDPIDTPPPVGTILEIRSSAPLNAS